MSDDEVQSEEIMDITSGAVMDKYLAAAGVANGALNAVAKAVARGVSVRELCKIGDSFIESECAKLYTKATTPEGDALLRGIAFPTCVSFDGLCGHYSPMTSESLKIPERATPVVVKIELAAHIDGYMASVAHTVVLPGAKGEALTGKKADTVKAAQVALDALLREVSVGAESLNVSKVIEDVCKSYGVSPVARVYSHEIARYSMDSANVIPMRMVEAGPERVLPFPFEANKVYVMDVVLSSGSGLCKETDLRTTVFRRAVGTGNGEAASLDEAINVQTNENLIKTSRGRQFVSEVVRKYPIYPFSVGGFADETGAKAALAEASKHNVFHAYPVMKDSACSSTVAEEQYSGEIIAQFQCTVMLMPNGIKRITTGPGVDAKTCESTKQPSEKVAALLAKSLDRRAKKTSSKGKPASPKATAQASPKAAPQAAKPAPAAAAPAAAAKPAAAPAATPAPKVAPKK